MSISRLLIALLLGVGLLAAPGSASTSAAPTAVASEEAGGGSPLDDLINPTYVDPIVALLAPLPTPYQPYDNKICRSGKAVCIERVVTEMKRRLVPLARSCSHHAIFSLAYLRVTQNVKRAVKEGYFRDRVWLRRLDAVFADMYFRTMDRWKAGKSVPPAWTTALNAADDSELNGLGDFMLNMNAHINNDFPRALVRAGLTAKAGWSHKSDHNAYNQRLDSLYAPVFAEEARRFDPTFDDINIGTVEETAAGLITRAWREAVWRNAEALANARTPAQKKLVTTWIDQYSNAQALLIKSIPIFQTPDAAARYDYCKKQQ